MKRLLSALLLLAWSFTTAYSETLSDAVSVRAHGFTCAAGKMFLLYETSTVSGERFLSLASSAEGTKWKELRRFPDAETGTLWLSPAGALTLFFSEGGKTYMSVSPNPADETPHWMADTEVGKGVVSGPPVVSGNQMILPFEGPAVMVSTNMGFSWSRREGPERKEAVRTENCTPRLYLRGDGAVGIVMRSDCEAVSFVSVSSDAGKSWGKAMKFIYNPAHNLFPVSLGGGYTLVVKNDRFDDRAYEYSKGLFAYITPDDGAHWFGGLQIDSREFVTDPLVFCDGENVLVAYSRQTREESEICIVRTGIGEISKAWGKLESAPSYPRITAVSAGKAADRLRKFTSQGKLTWDKGSLRVASYNIEWYGYVSSPTWEERLVAIKDLFDTYGFDVVGTQEPDEMMARTLKEKLGGKYDWVGTVEAEPGATSGQVPLNPIFYNVEKIEFISGGIFWYGVPHTKGFDAWGYRICNYARFRDKRSGLEFFCFNSHYDHRGHEAKEVSSHVLLEKIMELSEGLPVFCTGDFNTTETTPGYKVLVESGLLKDSMTSLPEGKRKNWEYFSMSHFKPMSTVAKSKLHLDHIFYTPGNSKVLSWQLITDSKDGVFGSDHLPIVIDWKIANSK